MTRRPVILSLDYARCPSTRTVPCSVAHDCARALVDGVGRYSQDFSIEARPGGKCGYHLPANQHQPASPTAGPKVHAPVKGIT